MRGQLTLNETEFTNRCSVLKRYVDANIDREKQVLYALQHLMHQMEHPNSKLLFCRHLRHDHLGYNHLRHDHDMIASTDRFLHDYLLHDHL